MKRNRVTFVFFLMVFLPTLMFSSTALGGDLNSSVKENFGTIFNIINMYNGIYNMITGVYEAITDAHETTTFSVVQMNYVYVRTNNVSVRTQPAVSSQSSIQVGLGDIVHVMDIEENNGEQWFHILTSDRITGYIPSNLLSVDLLIHIWSDGSGNYRVGGFEYIPDPSLKPIDDGFSVYIGSIQFSNGQAIEKNGNISTGLYDQILNEFSSLKFK